MTAGVRLVLTAIALLVLACSDPRDTAIPIEQARWDTDLRPTLDRLSQDERRLVTAYLSRKRGEAAVTGQPIAAGVTIRQALQEERDFQQADAARRSMARQQQDEQERQRKEYEGQVKAILPVALVSKQVTGPNLSTGSRSERATLVFEFQNLGERDVAEFRGTLRLMDSWRGDGLKSLDVRLAEPVPAGGAVRWEGTILLDPFITTDLRLKNTDTGQIAVVFLPQIVLFTDGTRLVMPPGLQAGSSG